MTYDINEEGYGKLKEVFDKTLHRFKNNLQTQLSLMNIQAATNRLYFDEKKVIVDRMFALTHIYDLHYNTRVDHNLSTDSEVSLQSFMLKLYQHLKSSTSKIDFKLIEISNVDVDIDDLLLLSYIVIEIDDYRKSLEDFLSLEIYRKEKKVFLKFSLSSIANHKEFNNLFKDQFKILDLLVSQLKGKFDYKKKFVRLSFPIL